MREGGDSPLRKEVATANGPREMVKPMKGREARKVSAREVRCCHVTLL